MLHFVPPVLQVQTNSAILQQRLTSAEEAKQKARERITAYLAEGTHKIGACISDNGGSAYYRIRFLSRYLEQVYDATVLAFDMPILLYPEIINHMESIRIQRANAKKHLPWLRKCFLPVKRNHPEIRMIYDVDDCLVREDIPKYNTACNYSDMDADVVREYMDRSDYVTVSTARLKNYYVRHCSVDPAKILVRPNRLPRFFSANYDPVAIFSRLRTLKTRKPRICFACTTTHVDMNNVNGGRDDFSGINQWIIEHRKKYQFVFLSVLPGPLRPYVDDFEIHDPVPFLQYQRKRLELNVDLLIQPLEKNTFNECKSAIKLHEAWAIGVPVLVQDIGIYKETDPQACFADADELDRKVCRLFAQPEEQVVTAIRANYDRMEPLWLENTYEEWLSLLFRIDGVTPSWQ